MFLDRVIHIGETLGDHVKGRSPIMPTAIIEDPNLVHVIAHNLSINMILIPSHSRVLTASYPFEGKFAR